MVLTTWQHDTYIHNYACSGNGNINECRGMKYFHIFVGVNYDYIFWLLKDNSRHKRDVELIDNEKPTDNHIHLWAIFVSSAVTIALLVILSVLCVGSGKGSQPPSSKLQPPSSKLVTISLY